MKTYFNLFLLFLWSFSIGSQAPSSSIVVVAVQGKVKYESSNYKKPINLNPGAVITTDGFIILEEGDKVTCLYNDKFFNVTGKGRKSISRAIGLIKPNTAISFDGEYSKFVKAAVEFKTIVQERDGWGGITNPKTSGDGWGGITPPKEAGDGWGGITQPKTSGDGWGGITNPKTSGDGWGEELKSIQPRMPYGYQVANLVTFRWTGPKEIKVYRLEILNSQNEVIHSETSKKTSIEVDLIALELNVGETYSWHVMPEDLESSEDIKKIKFMISSKKDEAAAQNKSSKTKLGASSDPVLKSLMQAAALELEEFYNAALERYEAALEEDPKNDMVRMQYSAFLMRLNWIEASQNVMNGLKF
ncbi:MAG: hypothetical protein IPM92_10465 [Saprospiraceae bacterium]|nr:hypothetical protein [Saprospiraceae bacterium]